MHSFARLSWMLVLAAALAGCGEKAATTAPDPVTVQLKWVHQAQFAGMYVAQEKGYYAKENLAVTFLEGGQGIDNAAPLLSGAAQFSVLAPEDVLIGRSKGKPLKAIAAIYRRSAVVFLTRAESNIRRPQDFEGKKVASGGKGGAVRDFQFQFDALVKKLGLDLSKIEIVPYDPTYAAFIGGQVDVTPAFSTGGLITLRREGVKLRPIWPSDYGIRFYSDTLVATDDTVEKNPELIMRFLRATLHGWRDAVEDGGQAVTMTLKYARVKDKTLQTGMMDALMPLVHTGEDHVGWMKREDWQGMYDVLLAEKILDAPFAPDQAFTMRFLDAVYGGQAQ